MSMTPTARDLLHTETVNLATDVAGMILEFRDRVGPEEAFGLAQEVLGLSDRILLARQSVTSAKSREHFAAGRLVCQRTMVALDGLAARHKIPLIRSAGLHERLSSLAKALGALAEARLWDSE